MAEEETQTQEAETQTPDAEEAAPAEKEKKPRAARGGKAGSGKIDQAFDLIKEMTVLELRDLNKRIEEEFGVTAAAPVAVAAAPGVVPGAAPGAAPAEAEEEKTEFTVLIKDIGPNKINVIKAVREVTTLGLKEAKDLVESAPVAVKEDVTKEEAENVKKKLEDAGAATELK